MLEPTSGRRGDSAFKVVALVAGLVVLAILGLIAVSTTKEAWPAFKQEGLGFVTSSTWIPAEGKFGALAFIYGTVLSSLIALVLAVPVSLGIALYANEAAPRRLRKPVVYVMDLLAAIPSVVYGLWGIIVLAPAIQPVYKAISGAVEDIPVLGWFFNGESGRSYMTAGIILAIMITPIVTSLSREVIATVPSAQREAAYGMGATRWEMIRAAVLPWSRGGIVGSVMLGLGRAMGETIAVALVIGSQPQITTHLFEAGDSMAAVIVNQFGEASGIHRSALIGLGVVLFGVTIIVNVSARGIVGRFDRRSQGA
ncbi:MAG: phosphate ABC transporter permease subunit PstC [Actinobacteria bacterium]|nr:phosphate ABC transporter permease subunit PstC [Actinomycetota bacterium]MSZ13936.1 phosphate ABC transporter permease subunit PstC [Actinomycetota bacterium]MTA87549.1 phosphate ABC transporter permease subunit PstC [Actinomycetota bacterium]MTB02155.1 phosphate ABC transporter permease subunit PstC [Actinomycetota bacterium]